MSANIFLINRIAEFVVRQAWCTVSLILMENSCSRQLEETGFQIVSLGTHGVHSLFFFFARENYCSRHLEFWPYLNSHNQCNCRLFIMHTWCALFVYSSWKILAGISWNFKRVQIFLMNCIADCGIRHIQHALSVFFYDGKILL